jgi:hypothetical protein
MIYSNSRGAAKESALSEQRWDIGKRMREAEAFSQTLIYFSAIARTK